jgi:hypothetical protein
MTAGNLQIKATILLEISKLAKPVGRVPGADPQAFFTGGPRPLRRDRQRTLKKVKRIKLGKQVYRRLMKKVLERDGWRCRKCGSLENLQVHHRIRRSQQGNDSLENLVTLCLLPHGGA